jgi:plasmid stabilization system protein ParE
MAFQLRVNQEADADVANIYLYYEETLSGLGDKFLTNLSHCFDQLKANPQFYSFIDSDKNNSLRDIVIKDFPYVIIYEISGDEVIIYAVHNWRKNPKH